MSVELLELAATASPPCLLATKLEAFKSRGREDLLGSRDFGDVIALIDGRAAVPSDAASQARVDEVILPALRQLAQTAEKGP